MALCTNIPNEPFTKCLLFTLQLSSSVLESLPATWEYIQQGWNNDFIELGGVSSTWPFWSPYSTEWTGRNSYYISWRDWCWLLGEGGREKYILSPGDSVAPHDAAMFSGKTKLRSIPLTPPSTTRDSGWLRSECLGSPISPTKFSLRNYTWLLWTDWKCMA